MEPKQPATASGGWKALQATAQMVWQHSRLSGVPTLLATNQTDGFDCPGCAWPDPEHRSSFEFCENGAKAVMNEATRERATPERIGARTLADWSEASDYELEAQGRLTEPLRYNPQSDRYERCEWDSAFAQIADALNACDSPHDAAFYTSGRTSNEAAFLYQLFVRAWGTNNLPDCSNMCHEPSGAGLNESIGVGKGTVRLADFDHAEAIFIWGQNPATNHPRMLGTLREASQRGCPVVVFNPLRERGLQRFVHPQKPLDMVKNAVGAGGTDIASHYLQLRPGGDLAACVGMAKALFDQHADRLDHAFLAGHTQGFEAWAGHVQSVAWPDIEAECGLSRAELEGVAAVYANSRACIFCWGMGITQHVRGVATIQTMTNLLLMLGNIGKPGAGACPVRGHSNVQGDRTMGIHEKPSAALLDALDARFGPAYGLKAPREDGMDVVGTLQAMQSGRVKVFVGMGGNFAAATPDTAATHAALARVGLTVHVATKFNRSHVVHGKAALVMPCLGRTELDVQGSGPQLISVEDSMSQVHMSAGQKKPASEHLRSEPWIVAQLAHATLSHPAARARGCAQMPWLQWADNYDLIRDLIAQTIPGHADYNQRVRVPLGFYLGNSAARRQWDNAAGKAVFKTHALGRGGPAPSAGVFDLITMRSHDQYNTTIYGLNDRYRGVYGQRNVVFMNAQDAAELGLQTGQRVKLSSALGTDDARQLGGLEVRMAEQPRGTLAAYYPECNVLIPSNWFADGARTPASKRVPVRVEPAL
jgi:molybdopterin-dependent oxidoreductase alpha subunit